MPVAKLKASNVTDVMKPEEGNDSIDTVYRPTITKEPLFPLLRSDNQFQLFQMLQSLDPQGSAYMDNPGWPLPMVTPMVTPLKVQMQKCDKCSREFFSSINYRRHIRVDHRLRKLDKDSAKNRDLLATFWDKLSDEEAKDILSFQDVTLEEVSGSSIVKSLTALVRKPAIYSYPHNCMRAGSALLDIIQCGPSKFPMSSEELFGILDDASENTFLCGTAVSMQKYIFNGEIGKIGQETKNLVASVSFLVEQKLVKAWLADKDAEALRCQKLLMEEEEAAERRQKHLLERKRQKKLRQKEQKAKEQRQGDKEDFKEHFDDMVDAEPTAQPSCSLTACDSDTHASETLSDEVSTLHISFQHPDRDKDVDLEIQIGSDSGCNDVSNDHIVDQQTLQGSSRRSIVVARWQNPQKSQWSHLTNGFHASQNSQAPKLSTAQKNGTHRDLKPIPPVNGNWKWSRKSKPENNGGGSKNRVQVEAISQADHIKKNEVMIGSISVTLGNCGHHEDANSDGAQDNHLPEHKSPRKNNNLEKHGKSESVQCGMNRTMVKLWRAVSRNGSKGPVGNGTTESQLDGAASKGEGEDQILSRDSCQISCTMHDNNSETGNSSSLVNENLCAGSTPFSSQAAQAFLAERWKETIAAEHVKLVLSPDFEPLESIELKNNIQVAAAQSSDMDGYTVSDHVENHFVDLGAQDASAVAAGKAKFRIKHEKGVKKLKYIPKQRTIS